MICAYLHVLSKYLDAKLGISMVYVLTRPLLI